jgi:anthranilate phosphoribosyltransferase
VQSVFSGEQGPAHDMVVLNAAAALWAAEMDSSPRACAQKAAEAIDSNAASRLLERWQRLSQET